MNKTAIKNYAIWARNKLISDIEYKAGLMGITEKGIAPALPQSTNEVQFFDIGTKDYATVRGDDIRQRDSFIAAIQVKERDVGYAQAFRYIVEKVAYTWFNRLVAIRFMEVNDYLPSRVRVLSSENPGKAEPDMVTRPFDTDMTFTHNEEDLIMRLKDENKLDELFRWLFIKQCKKLHDVLPVLFSDGQDEDYLELLLTISFTDKDGVLWHLVHDIPEDDFNVEKEGQVEIIGWMYQYYNTEPKDQVFADLKKNIKISKDKIPAATQLFTPDWIVRYMVENSLGRLWVEGHPNEELKKNWKYYLEEAEQEPEVQAQLDEIRKEYAKLRPEEIKVIDPCMGSGHILVYLFDVLMQIYESQGWTQREAAQSIVQNNLYGLDIDERAAQLAYFAVMMKARQYDRRFLERGIEPHVYDISESNDINRSQLRYFGSTLDEFTRHNAETQMHELLDTLHDAKEYGSILNAPALDWDLLRQFANEFDVGDQMSMEVADIEQTQTKLNQLISQEEALAQKYDVVVTNPPYMGAAGMENSLAVFLKKIYPDSKTDMSTVFMEKCVNYCSAMGIVGMINIPVWMFITSFEKLRKSIIKEHTIVNMLHFGRGVFGSDFGTTSFIIQKCKVSNYSSLFYKLFDKPGSVDALEKKEKWFFEGRGRCIRKQDDLLVIPGAPLAYWISDNALKKFQGNLISRNIKACVGMRTGDNDKFMRLWHEVEYSKMCVGAETVVEAMNRKAKWIPYNKGGEFRKWYGNQEYVVNWENNGYEIKENTKRVYPQLGNNLGWKISNEPLYFQDHLCWTDLTIKGVCFRYFPKGFIFDASVNVAFPISGDYQKPLGYLNSKIVEMYSSLLNPTVHFKIGNFNALPYVEPQINTTEQVNNCIRIAKSDWDSYETSWDFKRHPLL